VDEDLLVLFAPGVEGVPLEADRAGQAVDGVVALEPGCAWLGGPVGPEAVEVGGPAVEALWALLVDEQVRVQIGCAQRAEARVRLPGKTPGQAVTNRL
jgi:hypothetical protein